MHNNGDVTFKEKLFWLRHLDEARVPRAALRVADGDAGEMVERARDMGLQIELELYGQSWIKENWQRVLATARDCGATSTYFTARGADWALQAMAKQSESPIGASNPDASAAELRHEMLDAAMECVKATKDAGLRCALAIPYATQADLGFLQEMAGAGEALGLDWIQFCDTMGGAGPAAFRTMVSTVKKAAPKVKIEVHCHNDCAQSVANVIASVEAGAEGADVIVEGADPRRGGNASLAEVAVSLEFLCGVDTGIDLTKLTGLSQLHEALWNWPIPLHHPIVGPEAFSLHFYPGRHHQGYKAGEVLGVERDPFYATPETEGEPFNPEAVGNKHVLVLGRYSGPNEVEQRLRELGLDVTDAPLDAVVEMVRDRGKRSRRTVTDDEVRLFVDIAQTAT
jgi:isopropylmalate/homocitrate/citramalate synthase